MPNRKARIPRMQREVVSNQQKKRTQRATSLSAKRAAVRSGPRSEDRRFAPPEHRIGERAADQEERKRPYYRMVARHGRFRAHEVDGLRPRPFLESVAFAAQRAEMKGAAAGHQR